MNTLRYLSIACALTLGTNAMELEPITVTTASLGQEQSIDDVQASVEILDQKTIKSLSGRTTAQVLNEAVGLNVKDGSSSTNISIRGFSDEQTLILVDGMRITGKYGSADVSGIALEDIERIEIVRGPMSALYGSDAMGGVVNIITKNASNKDSATITVIGGVAQNGDRETGIVRANVNLGGEKISHKISAEIKERGDYRREKDDIGTDLREESHKSLSYSNLIKFGEDTLKTRFELFDQDDSGVSHTVLPRPPFSITSDTYEQERRYQANAVYNHVGEKYLLDTNFAYGYSDADVNRASGNENTKYSQVEFNSYLRMFSSDDMIHIVGIGAKKEDIEVSIYSQDADRTNYNILYQNEWDITQNFSTVLGLRFDDYSDFGSTVNPRVSAQYKLDSVNLRASYGEAFKAPSFTNMYSSFYRGGGRLHIYGNPDLKPETSKTYELSAAYSTGKFAMDLVLHRSELDDLIDSYYVDAANVTYTNIAKATIQGAELSMTYQATEDFRIKGSLEHLDAKDDNTGERLPESAKITGKLHLAYAMQDTTFYLNVRTQQDYLGVIEGTRPAKYEEIDYTSADVKVTHQWNEQIEFSAGVDNITDEEMPYGLTLFGTPSDPGERYYYVGMTAKF